MYLLFLCILNVMAVSGDILQPIGGQHHLGETTTLYDTSAELSNGNLVFGFSYLSQNGDRWANCSAVITTSNGTVIKTVYNSFTGYYAIQALPFVVALSTGFIFGCAENQIGGIKSVTMITLRYTNTGSVIPGSEVNFTAVPDYDTLFSRFQLLPNSEGFAIINTGYSEGLYNFQKFNDEGKLLLDRNVTGLGTLCPAISTAVILKGGDIAFTCGANPENVTFILSGINGSLITQIYNPKEPPVSIGQSHVVPRPEGGYCYFRGDLMWEYSSNYTLLNGVVQMPGIFVAASAGPSGVIVLTLTSNLVFCTVNIVQGVVSECQTVDSPPDGNEYLTQMIRPTGTNNLMVTICYELGPGADSCYAQLYRILV
eukprot:TRINITY_DN30460_c0_g1_i1.p1 TRINITY_DN30460_c0_g1~~TRINITY_DN30460_c0_g1_i1.p1  ORF type:complete len:370 (+),score=34.04 TRINITY_DN30460_c0_g1_i1:41-1150(+)